MKKTLLLAVATLAPAFLFAQQKDLHLNEVVVTANKFDQKASQTGKVLTVISQEELQHSSGKTLGTILNEQAGLTINGAGGAPGTYQSVYMRGADVKYTLIMIDGVPVQDISPNNVQFDLNLLPVSAIERIEIMRGGYATLYGSGAAAGVINIITKKGGKKPFNASIEFKGGSYGTFYENAAVYGSKNSFDYNIHFQNMDSKGFSAAEDTLKNKAFDEDGFHRKTFFANLGFAPDEDWNIRPYFRYTYEKSDLDAAAFVDDKDYAYTSKLIQAGVNINYTFQNGDLHIKYAFNPIERHYMNDTLDHSAYLQSRYKSFVHTADVYSHFIFNSHASLLAGVSGKSMKTDQYMKGITEFGPYESRLSGDSAQTDALNVYSSFFLNTENGFHLEAGGRLNHHKTYGFHPVFSLNPSWLIHKKVKVFLNMASSFSAPSLYQLYSLYGNAKLKPESGYSYEGGLELFALQDHFNARITAFVRNMKDVIAFQLTDPATYTYQYVNYDKQKDHGGEVELNYTLNDNWKLSAWYAYVNGKITMKNEQSKTDSTYFNLFKRPKHSAGLSVSYQLSPGLFISADGKYTGRRKDLVFIGNTQQVKDLDGYFLLNAYVQYVFKKKYKAFISLHNITNSSYTETTGFATKGFNFEAGLRLTLF